MNLRPILSSRVWSRTCLDARREHRRSALNRKGIQRLTWCTARLPSIKVNRPKRGRERRSNRYSSRDLPLGVPTLPNEANREAESKDNGPDNPVGGEAYFVTVPILIPAAQRYLFPSGTYLSVIVRRRFCRVTASKKPDRRGTGGADGFAAS